MSKSLSLHDAAAIERLRAAAIDFGRRWAREVVSSLHGAGRRASGGWPGTLSEARSYAAPLLRDTAFEAPSDAREEVARVLYAAARTDWLGRRDANRDDDGLDELAVAPRRRAH
ncbi:MAG: hypothetical protein KF729_30195 [Sandaracinaceae bacterium]|nr:hypothetical protein [Sandaracinaceae bacterium]